jgi:hypothetical protein
MRTEEDRIVTEPMLVIPRWDPRPSMLRTARLLSWILVVLLVAAALVSLTVHGLFAEESAWGREAFRGGDLVTLIVAVPLLIGALVAMRGGSVRAGAVWVGVLFYSLYMYAYAVFGATFNDIFLLHIGVFSLSLFALACALPALDYGALGMTFGPNRWPKVAGIFLVVVGVLQGALWLFVVGRNAINGEVLHDIPVGGQHIVFALDLSLLVPMLILSGVLLARRRSIGFLLGTAMAVMGAITQLNLMIAGLFQANADVAGIKAFPPESLFLTATFILAALAMLLGGRTADG